MRREEIDRLEKFFFGEDDGIVPRAEGLSRGSSLASPSLTDHWGNCGTQRLRVQQKQSASLSSMRTRGRLPQSAPRGGRLTTSPFSLLNDLRQKPAEVEHDVQIYCAERYWLFGDRGNSNCLAGGNTDSLQGTPFRRPRASAYARDWSDRRCDRMAYLFGGRSGARQFIVASVIDRLVFVPAVLVPVAIAGVVSPTFF